MVLTYKNRTIKTVLIIVGVLVLASIGYISLIANKSAATKYANSIVTALNNERCTSIHPLNGIKSLSNETVCPRGDVGNFMVIDKVEYKLEAVTGSKFSNRYQALLKVCVEAHGNARWNERNYSDCTTDARIISLRAKGLSWQVVPTDFTDLSKLLNESGAKPEGYEEFSRQCWDMRVQNYIETGEPVGRVCNNAVESDVLYSIKTHKFVETGKSR